MELNSFLRKKGYSEFILDPVYRDEAKYCYKRVPTTEKHQFVIREWRPHRFKDKPSYELEMTFETAHEIWSTLKFYGLNETQLKVHLDRLETNLFGAMNSMDANPTHYRFDGSD